ncbi:MAG: hypothetical protein CFE41_01765 [Burkholderiales bacterium PBB2]|nr:MAG: hypothetical protein CFE41_01765 [Burkholderiales bacterium PBB2]
MVDGGEDKSTAQSTQPQPLRGRVNAPQLVPSSGRVDFARYELRELLGEGGYGAVYAAWDSRLQRSVALKRLNLQVSAAGDAEAWVQEARLAARVSHRAFVTVYDVFVDQGAGHIVMERVQGRSLSRVLAAGPLSVEQALDWALQASEALAEAHQLNIAHGDIKPANLMIDDSGRLRILDFGVARLIDRMATLGPGVSGTFGTSGASAQPLVSGTLAYMAPEQMLGRPASVASDIYALGLVMGEMLSGQRAFMEPDPLALAHHKLHGSELILALPELPPGLAPLAALVQRMVSRQPELRPASMAEVHEALLNLQDGWLPGSTFPRPRSVPATARPLLQAEGLPPSPAAAGTRRWLWGGAAALLFGLGLAASQGYLRLPGQPAPWPQRLAQAEQLIQGSDEDFGALEQALGLLEQLAAEKPLHAWVQATLALAYATRYHNESVDEAWLQRADASSQLALRHDPMLALSHAARGMVLKLQGRSAEAESAYAKALSLDGQDAQVINGYGMFLTRQRRLDEAQLLFEGALKRHPQDSRLMDNLGTVFYEKGDLAAAEALFRRSIAQRAGGVNSYANLSAVLLRTDRADEAEALLQQGLKARPSSQLYTNLGNLLYNRGRYVQAAEAFEAALSADKGRPGDYLMWANWADTLLLLPGRGEQAREGYGRALQLLEPLLARYPKDATLLSRAGLYAARSQDRQRATDWTQRALQLAPLVPDVLFRATLAAELSGQRDLALARLQQARAAGYPAHLIEQEPTLAALRSERRYHHQQAQ